ncbi:MAG: hypothetical protein AB7P04_04770 [Bacteriovoracia bacterium]
MNRLAFWLLLTLGIRFLSAVTRSSWNHPDEWYQTVEFANLLVNGAAAYTQEIGLHMRNLSWPLLLALPLKFANWIAPGHVGFRVFSVEFFTGLVNLGLIGAWWSWLTSALASIRPIERAWRWRSIGMGLFVLPFFFSTDAIRPSQEHLSVVMSFLALAFFHRKRWLFTGICLVGIGAVKYPAGLLSLGMLVAFCLRHPRPFLPALLRMGGGLAIGALIFFAGDAAVYGRAWESLWMFVQYNVFTGLSHQNFGAQSGLSYMEHFQSRWGFGFVWIPVGALLLFGWLRGLPRFVRDYDPAFWGIAAYLAGHLAIAHKEPRFMLPVEYLLTATGFIALATDTRAREGMEAGFGKFRAVRWISYAAMFGGTLLLAHTWLRENWVAKETYFELNSHLEEIKRPCAIVTVRKPMAVDLPPLSAGALGYLTASRRVLSDEGLEQMPLTWIESAPHCEPGQSVLLHLHNPRPSWEERGCRLLRSGILRVMPESWQAAALAKNWVSGPWYACPATVLGAFPRQETRAILARVIRPLAQLPPLGTTGEQLTELLRSREPGVGDGTLGDR